MTERIERFALRRRDRAPVPARHLGLGARRAPWSGLMIALQLRQPEFNFGLPWISFGRLRPLHTNAAIFAFAGNAIFAAIYYSTQRLLKARMWSDILSRLHFWGWQAHHRRPPRSRCPSASRQSKEYAELEWPIDIAIAVVWVLFAVNFFGTVARAARAAHLRRASGSTSRRSSPSPSCTSSTTWSSCRARSRATRSTPACRTRSCSGGTATTPSRSS